MPLKGLDVAESQLTKDLHKIIEDAYKALFNSTGGDTDKFMKKQIDLSAKLFADSTAEPCAKAIHKFLLEMKVDVTVSGTIISPPAPPALPGGPCTGSIPAMSQMKIS